MIFWILCIAFTLITFALVFIFHTMHSANTTHSRDEINKAFYFHRLEEIQQDEAKGLLEDKQQSTQELQQNLLQDIPDYHQQKIQDLTSQKNIKLIIALSFLTVAVFSFGTYYQRGSWQAQQNLTKITEQLPYFYQRWQSQEKNPLNPSELEQFAFALRVKLQNTPNAQDWWQLGEIAFQQSKLSLAKDSYAKAFELDKNNPRYILPYARFLMFADNKIEQIKGEQMVRGVLRSKPNMDNTLEALSLLAFQYFSRKDYKMAAATWAMMLEMVPENHPKARILQQSFMVAQEALENEEKKK